MSKFLEDFSTMMNSRPHHMHRIAEIKGDGAPEIKELTPATPCQNVYSIAKAFTVTAIGFLVDRHLLSTDETIPAALGNCCPDSYDPLWNSTTVHALLKHQVGLPVGFLDIDTQDANAFGNDYLAYAMNYPLLPDHGTVYRYTDAAYYILARIAENRAGTTLDNFLWQELFHPLAFRDAAWSHCPMGHAMGATGLFLRVEDTVKLGALYMHGGVWKGRRLLSERWVNTVLENRYEFTPKGDGNAYGKGGMLGQNLIVIPNQQRVVAWQAADSLGQENISDFICRYQD